LLDPENCLGTSGLGSVVLLDSFEMSEFFFQAPDPTDVFSSTSLENVKTQKNVLKIPRDLSKPI
jgi:hypothetical protein